jgi:GT2 family glycosyltransferase
MNSESFIGIMVLNYNGKQWLSPLFESIRRNGYPGIRIYLVDNGSTDGSVEATLRDHPDVTVMRMPKNLGYCMAYNLAMPHAFADGCEWVIWANSDILLEPGCLQELMRTVHSDPNIGVVGPAFLSWDGKEPNYYMQGKHPALVKAMSERSSVPVDVDWVEGSFLMVSRETVEKAGPLDPCFFAFWEEAEFCRRVRYLGKRVVLAPAAWARHYGGVSFSNASGKKLKTWLQSRNFHIYELMDPHRSFARNLLSSAHLLAANVKFASKTSLRAVVLELRAYATVLLNVQMWHRKWLDERRHIKPPIVEKRYRGLQPEILFSPSREVALGK